ncbi:PD40 domain-containing protein [Candidatus Falkowbacteria bacterium]|nr:PD40 domain-containing protein [Candidatus Falkowbacteria bacterium]
MKKTFLLLSAILILTAGGCEQAPAELPSRESKIPTDAVKITPATDVSPVKSLSAEYENPIPLPAPVNTAGAEDSPFILPDGNTLYFFFTPDVKVPVEKQIIDNVTGIYVAKKSGDKWLNPERVLLSKPGGVGSDGCEFVRGNIIWFCSVREGYDGIHWFTAEFKNNKWQNWKNADFPPDYKVGELHFTSDGNEVYFHSDRPGGKGGLDIWVSKKVDGEWLEPENVSAVNTSGDEGWPALSPDENELWITKDYGIWRSKKINGEWGKPKLMFSPLAGEATIDSAGNVYFVHHYYKDDQMLEADIYVANKK